MLDHLIKLFKFLVVDPNIFENIIKLNFLNKLRKIFDNLYFKKTFFKPPNYHIFKHHTMIPWYFDAIEETNSGIDFEINILFFQP